jgi:thiol-disulfide isomerase/thioredoxin
MGKFYSIHKNKKDHKKTIELFNKHIKNPKGKTFILIFMHGCEPCEATRPEWEKLENLLDHDFMDKNHIAIADVDMELTKHLDSVQEAPGFPTMRFISNNGENQIVENYEDSNIDSKDRSVDSFIEWIKEKTREPNVTRSEFKGGKRRRKSKRINKKTKKNNKKSRKTRKNRK